MGPFGPQTAVFLLGDLTALQRPKATVRQTKSHRTRHAVGLRHQALLPRHEGFAMNTKATTLPDSPAPHDAIEGRWPWVRHLPFWGLVWRVHVSREGAR